MTTLLALSLRVALGLLVLAMAFALVRLVRGPAPEDRILAFDALSIDAMLLMLTLGLAYGSATYLEAALLVSLLGFVSTSAMAKFVLRGEVIE